MPLSDLIQLMPPPTSPSFPPTEKDWKEAEERLSTPLPSDYKTFVSLYGAGMVGGEICILNPILPAPNCCNLIYWTEFMLRSLRETREEFPDPEDYGFLLYPETGGLLPCGLTNNAHTLYWETIGPPNEWPILVLEARSPYRERYAMTITEFIEALVKEEIKSPELRLFVPGTLFEPFEPSL